MYRYVDRVYGIWLFFVRSALRAADSWKLEQLQCTHAPSRLVKSTVKGFANLQ